ncbi:MULTISPECIES: ribosome maturation factor RimM [Aminobacterium]|jgi:16S rRNA processing protein RimM|uniref:Ribosome maturation factor RimM n=1 Tax=Aminobacterium colombiense (strain DSM 12261 / ALA-1) TaxID=572547 RepID=D5EDQ8_AMICL|nr:MULTISPECIES: ribosome maturation factor RimM [Aminobacterium]MDD2379244.1 ribosome maturation factor RimM [Aminobacterium colombiense]ADE56690.1 16S rRNA processing protein RimM [Aminobacterium colombiense DSM 12261]MDD3767815.1 ribosome maturation factor RimM [Aminobacterium colombiense]MDD4265555.1 ribosome maturation factor RimM [Aminobacterium colombiense]MDD4585941.1 ribosome maturation factor RimM [Aminobacterium colombiense]
MENRNLVTIGRIVGVHGLRGGIKIFPLTDFPQRFFTMKNLAVYGEDEKPLAVLTVQDMKFLDGKGIIVAETRELQTPKSAESLKDCLIKITSEERYSLEEGEYWIDDLIGMKVFEKGSGRYLGMVHNVFFAGENDIYTVISDDGKEHFIPAVSEFIKKVDIDNRVMEVEMIEGLWE